MRGALLGKRNVYNLKHPDITLDQILGSPDIESRWENAGVNVLN